MSSRPTSAAAMPSSSQQASHLGLPCRVHCQDEEERALDTWRHGHGDRAPGGPGACRCHRAQPWLAGIASIYDRSFEGSAEGYVPAEVADPDDFYVFKLARPGWALADGHTVEVPASTGNPRGRCYVADAGQPLFCAFRAYMEPETGAGPAYSELIWDRLMVFHKKEDAD